MKLNLRLTKTWEIYERGDIKTRHAHIEIYWENKAIQLTTDNLKLRIY